MSMTLSQLLHRTFKKDTSKVRDVYQEEQSESLHRRRKIVAISILGVVNACLVTLRQTGIIAELPDPDHEIFDANAVTSSAKAYDLRLPDGPLSILAFSGIMILATYGGSRDVRRTPVFNKALLGVVGLNALAGVQYLLNMTFVQKKICLYCITATSINLSLVPLAWRETLSPAHH